MSQVRPITADTPSNGEDFDNINYDDVTRYDSRLVESQRAQIAQRVSNMADRVDTLLKQASETGALVKINTTVTFKIRFES
jgi:hypothetical protein